MTALLTAATVTGLLLLGFGVIGWWAHRDEVRRARACHPSNFGRETSAAMDEAIALVGESLMDEIESYLRSREPRR